MLMGREGDAQKLKCLYHSSDTQICPEILLCDGARHSDSLRSISSSLTSRPERKVVSTTRTPTIAGSIKKFGSIQERFNFKHSTTFVSCYVSSWNCTRFTVAMSVKDDVKAVKVNKRKREEDIAEIEVDLTAAEPPSKKALRKAKRSKSDLETPNGTEVRDRTNVQARPDDKDERTRSKYAIWIGNLLFTTTKADLMTFITSDPEYKIAEQNVTRINLPTGRPRPGQAKNQNQGFAYVDFDTAETLETALQLSEKLFMGRRVLIKDATSFEGRPATKEEVDSGKPPNRKLFVGNLAFDTTVEALEEHFAVCGTINKTQVATFEDSGKCKGYAWVEFEDLASAQAAKRGWLEEGSDGGVQRKTRRIWVNTLNGRRLRTEFAEDSKTRYAKRYGKDAKKPPQNADSEDVQEAPIVEVNDVKPVGSRPAKVKPNRSRRGYTEETVQKLTGGIVEGKGQKVTFD